MLNFATYTGGIAATNAYLVEAPDGPILIDAPGGCADWIRSRGASVKALILTHQHFDHCLDAAQIADDHGCKVFSHSQLSISLTLEEFFGALGGSFAVRPFSAVEIGGDERLTAGGLAFELIYLPGHSQDSLCFYHRESGTLFAGDTLMATANIGRSDFPGGNGPLLVTNIREKLFALPEDTTVAPGHGPLTTIGIEKATFQF